MTARRRAATRGLLPIGWAAVMAVSASIEAVALACPSCPTSRAVSAIVCGPGVWSNLASVMAPFAVFAIIAWRLHGGGKLRRRE